MTMDDDVLDVIDQCESIAAVADRLAAAIAYLTGIPVGDHTHGNDPWANALAAANQVAGDPVPAVSEQQAPRPCGQCSALPHRPHDPTCPEVLYPNDTDTAAEEATRDA